MSVLINENGTVFAKTEKINQLLSPIEVGRFEVCPQAKDIIDREINDNNVNKLFDFIPKEMSQLCTVRNLIPTQASVFRRKEEEINKRSGASEIPHINEGNEIHFFFAGSYIIYFNINNQHYSLIVQEGDWLYIPADVEHWIKATDDNYLVIVSYHSEPFDVFHSKVKYTATKSRAFIGA